jgi:hypothetical protein
MPGDGAPRGPRPAVLYIPQPSVQRGPGARSVLLVLLVVGGGVAAAYRYWPPPAEPKAPAAPAMKASSAPATEDTTPVELPPTEHFAQPAAKPQPSPGGAPPAPNQPIVEVKPSEPRGTRSVSPDWFDDAEGLGRAKKEQAYAGVPMIIYFRVDWCPYCRRMDQDIISSSSVSQFLANVVKVRINPESSPDNAELARSMGVSRYPSVFVVPHPGSTPEKIHSLSRKENEPMELSAEKWLS